MHKYSKSVASHDKLTGCFRHLFSCLGLRILTQPKSVLCQPGDKLRFSIATSKTAKAYQWCLNGMKIPTDNNDYEGCISEKLFINRCLPKHKGSYQCIVVNELDTSLSTEIATLKIGMYTELLLCCPQSDPELEVYRSV